MDFDNIDKESESDGYINVNGSDDPFYRYKMPPLKVKFQAKNGGTTVIINADKVAQAIYREISDLKKCFSKGISASVEASNGTLMIPGQYEQGKLQEVLMKYILRDVLCTGCKNPETVKSSKSKSNRRCQACGKIN